MVDWAWWKIRVKLESNDIIYCSRSTLVRLSPTRLISHATRWTHAPKTDGYLSFHLTHNHRHTLLPTSVLWNLSEVKREWICNSAHAHEMATGPSTTKVLGRYFKLMLRKLRPRSKKRAKLSQALLNRPPTLRTQIVLRRQRQIPVEAMVLLREARKSHQKFANTALFLLHNMIAQHGCPIEESGTDHESALSVLLEEYYSPGSCFSEYRNTNIRYLQASKEVNSGCRSSYFWSWFDTHNSGAVWAILRSL